MIPRFRVMGAGPLVDRIVATQVIRLRPLLAFALTEGVRPEAIFAAVSNVRVRVRTLGTVGVMLAELLTGLEWLPPDA
jgi:hypothetical protein